jgi:hypothetical protein
VPVLHLTAASTATARRLPNRDTSLFIADAIAIDVVHGSSLTAKASIRRR